MKRHAMLLAVIGWLCCALVMAAGPEGGFPVSLEPWEIERPEQIVAGVLTSDSDGSRYVAELRSSQPAPRRTPYHAPLAGRAVAYASPGNRCDVRSDGGTDGRIDFEQRGEGYCGVSLKLAKPDDAKGRDLFAWMRGSGSVQVRVADAAWHAREDSVLLAKVTLGPRWRRVRVPVRHDRLDPSRLLSVVFGGEGKGQLEWSGLCRVQAGDPGPPPPAEIRRTQARAPGTAVWIWDTEQRLAASDPGWIDFLRQQQVSVVFLQVPPEPGPKLAQLVGTLRARGFEVQALGGDRHDVLPAGRVQSLARLDRLLAWQEGLPAEQRFQGIHLDVEPYLLPGFAGARQDDFLRAYLFLVEEAGARAHAQGLPLGVDIPCWYDHLPSFSAAGQERSPLAHIFDRVDEVAVMSYRTSAERVLESSRSEREEALRRGTRIWLGLETEKLPDETSVRFEGVPRRGVAGVGEVVLADGRFHLGPHRAEGWVWPIRSREETLARHLSFAGLGAGPLDRVRNEIRRQASEAGQAVHHLSSWWNLVGR